MNKRGLFVTPTLIGFEREQRKTKDFDWEKKKKGKNRKQSNQWLICEWPETDSDNTVEEVRSKGSVANSYTPAKTNMGALLKSPVNFFNNQKRKKKRKKRKKHFTAMVFDRKSIFYGKHYCDPITGAQHNPLRLAPSYMYYIYCTDCIYTLASWIRLPYILYIRDGPTRPSIIYRDLVYVCRQCII